MTVHEINHGGLLPERSQFLAGACRFAAFELSQSCTSAKKVRVEQRVGQADYRSAHNIEVQIQEDLRT